MKNEKISALMDRQGTSGQRREIFDHLLRDDAARKVWQRYHLIGCVLRGEVEQTGADLSERIRAQLENEPTILAPVKRPARTRVVEWSRRPAIWKSAGMLALAASVAWMAVIALQPASEDGAGNPIAANQPADGGAVPPGPTGLEQEFGEMLAQHGEFASSPGLNGLLVYAKLVSNAPLER